MTAELRPGKIFKGAAVATLAGIGAATVGYFEGSLVVFTAGSLATALGLAVCDVEGRHRLGNETPAADSDSTLIFERPKK